MKYTELGAYVDDLLWQIHHVLWAIDDIADAEKELAEGEPNGPNKFNADIIKLVLAASEEEKKEATEDIGDGGWDFSSTAHHIRTEKEWYGCRRRK